MKYNRIITFTVCNAFMMLSLASLLAGCQKKLYPSTGYFSQDPGRSPASIDSGFYQYQDPKQIFIYCSLNKSVVENCYQEKFDLALKQYQAQFGELNTADLQQLKQSNSFNDVSAKVYNLARKLEQQLEPEINKYVNQRKIFCQKNSKYFFNKCLKQFTEKDSFAVLNKFHQKNQMNGQEYLFLKDRILARMKAGLEQVKELQPI